MCEELWVSSWQRQETSSPKQPDWLWVPSSSVSTKGSFPVVKGLGSEADHQYQVLRPRKSGTLHHFPHAFTVYTGTWTFTLSFSALCALKFVFGLFHSMVSHYNVNFPSICLEHLSPPCSISAYRPICANTGYAYLIKGTP
jgi:hypothetical protein